jgi:hypothetical protein
MLRRAPGIGRRDDAARRNEEKPMQMNMPEDPVATILHPDETVQLVAKARQARVVITDRQLAVADEQRVALHVSYQALRRIQFDIERDRPATLVIVPESPVDEPQVLAIPPEQFESVAQALVVIGRRLSE